MNWTATYNPAGTPTLDLAGDPVPNEWEDVVGYWTSFACDDDEEADTEEGEEEDPPPRRPASIEQASAPAPDSKESINDQPNERARGPPLDPHPYNKGPRPGRATLRHPSQSAPKAGGLF